MNVIKVIDWLKTTPIPLTQISKETGISRNTLHLWINGSTPRSKNVAKLYNHYRLYITEDKLKLKNRSTKGVRMSLGSDDSTGEREIESHYVIGLQQDKIAYQQEEIESLKTVLKEKQAESTHWDMLEFDYITHVKLIRTGFKIGRAILSVDTITPLAKRLGYSEDELNKYFAIGSEYPDMDTHPINELIDNDSKKVLEEHTRSMPYIFESLKNLVGNHYLPVPVTYICKDRVHKVHTITYNKVNWSGLNVESKTQFINN